jgi:hypothetical protein
MQRNEVKKNLMRAPGQLSEESALKNTFQNASSQNVSLETLDELDHLEKLLPEELRPFFAQLRKGEAVPLEVEEEILFLIKRNIPPS